VQDRGRELLGLAAGALHIEFGCFAPPRVTAAVLVDTTGAKQYFVHVVSSIRLHGDVNARMGQTRPDGRVEVVEVVAPPPQTRTWTELPPDRSAATLVSIHMP
jgi:hypothetical protein